MTCRPSEVHVAGTITGISACAKQCGASPSSRCRWLSSATAAVLGKRWGAAESPRGCNRHDGEERACFVKGGGGGGGGGDGGGVWSVSQTQRLDWISVPRAGMVGPPGEGGLRTKRVAGSDGLQSSVLFTLLGVICSYRCVQHSVLASTAVASPLVASAATACCSRVGDNNCRRVGDYSSV